jgi:Hemerythrin HHE cation binding domain
MADITDLIFEDHHWFRRQFFYLDEAKNVEELTAIWEPLATRLDTHADAEERIFYPALLKKSKDPDEETEDAIGDHNKIRDAVADSRRHEVGSDEWFEAVARARKENGEHLEEEEREGLPDFRKNGTAALKHRLAMEWLRFFYEHPLGQGVDERDKDPDAYIKEHS